MISVELKRPDPGLELDEVEIYLDQKGLETFLAQLSFLKDCETEHIHLMCELWGGSHLENHPLGTNSIPIRHLKIVLR